MKNLSRYVILGAAVAVAGFLLWYFSNILTYILIAAALSLIGKPVVSFFRNLQVGKHKLPDWLSAFLALLCLVGVFIAFIVFFVPVLADFAATIGNIDLTVLESRLSVPLDRLNAFLDELFHNSLEHVTVGSLIQAVLSPVIDLDRLEFFFASLAGRTVNFFINFFVVMFITFFFLKEQHIFTNMVASLFSDKNEPGARRALKNSYALLTRYFIGIFAEIAAVTILNTLGWTLLCGIPLRMAVVMAFLSGVLFVIPYIGPLTGILGVLFTGFLHYYYAGSSAFGIVWFLVLVFLVFLLTYIIDLLAFHPYIYAKSVKAHPLEIFLVILAGAGIGGITGMLIAIPAYTVLRVFAGEFLYNFKIVRKLTIQFRQRDKKGAR
ncbi:MAG: AI-2E family transporter [Bacteroidales bacterium]|jgi:predicted PurR-regulated permease PerM|nr:AI-2E family transporter [Bacteroidales bacterium]MDD3101218.1 AI-2E family transporter [Bacteroidales bacterium]MDD3944672.1 AI-2E family transporter [Bacteroidales bacterium]MDD5314595.1 AI-2E family transporter [Bacteroidales bacterium]